MGFIRNFATEFKAFAMRGNVIDMAVGIVIGVAFGGIVNSLVKDVIMPPIGILLNGIDFSKLAITLKDAVPAVGDTPAIAAVTLNYGLFINTIINFIIVALAIFCVIKLMSVAKKKKEAAPPPPPAPSNEERLLGEIRDILKARR